MAEKKKRILLGLSGGVDSSVSALLLQKAGYDVTAGFMRTYVSNDPRCTTREDRDAALAAAKHMDIKTFIIFDFVEEYRARVIEPLHAGYASGITPNPDASCNEFIKFGRFLEEAQTLGFDGIATGHYARTQMIDGTTRLLKGVDENKDQSYFLARMNPNVLPYIQFPIGDIVKSEVRRIAAEANLPNAERKDSQGICFVGKVPMAEFLAHELPENPWDIIDTSGKVVGTHRGLWHYTIGQRKDIRIGGGPALFVVAKDTVHNRLIVGIGDDAGLFTQEVYAHSWQWMGPKRSLPLNCGIKLRYRQPDADAILTWEDESNGCVRANFSIPQRAATSGQVLAAYVGDELIGSAIIS